MAGFAALLLAAGESRRMGRPKALLPWKGSTLLHCQISALLEAGIATVLVVLGHQAESLKPIIDSLEGVEWVINPDYAHGKTTSIKAGLNALGHEEPDAVVILNVDQPRESETIRELLRHHHTRGGLITIPTHQGKGGHPIVVASALLDELGTISEGTLGVKAVVRAHEDTTHRVEMATPQVLWDLNTPAEYESALRFAAESE